MHSTTPRGCFALPGSQAARLRIFSRFGKALLFLALLALPLVAAADSVFIDYLAYTNGPLAVANPGVWTNYIGTPNQISVISGRANLSSLNSEGVSAVLTNGPYSNGTLYASFVINVSALPTLTGSYIAQFIDDTGTNYRSRVFVSRSGAPAGRFRVGIANASDTTPTNNLIAFDLLPNTNYVLVVRYDVISASSTLWINPASELETNRVTFDTDLTESVSIASFALHEDSQIGRLTVDTVRVGTNFNDIVGGINESYTIVLPSGFSYIANQLDHGNNALSVLFTNLPDGTYVTLFPRTNCAVTNTYYFDSTLGVDPGNWYDQNFIPVNASNIVFSPGDVALINNPSSATPVTFTGKPHIPVLPLTFACGCNRNYLVSRQVNAPGTFEEITGYSPGSGAKMLRWNGVGFTTYTFVGAGFWTPSVPVADVGESVYVFMTCGTLQLGIVVQPQSQTVDPGTNVTFHVVASGPGVLYQWRLNGVNIVGATNSSFSITNVQPADSGDYSVVVFNAGNAISSAVAQLVVNCTDLGLTDSFSSAPFNFDFSGAGSSTNGDASKEIGEPNHANNPGGKSVWFAWVAPTSGIATFSTRGSAFDTVLGVYTGSTVSTLTRVISDDDRGGFYASRVMFNAVSGTTYYLAVDGSYGISGRIVLGWDLESTPDQLPEILDGPHSRIAPLGTNVTLTVTPAFNNGPVFYQWFQNAVAVQDETNASIIITNLAVSKMGMYTVNVTAVAGGRSALSQAAIVQIGNNGSVAALDKFLDVTAGGVGAQIRPRAALASGFSGTQMFSTRGWLKEPGEPNHCGVAGGASAWYSYLPPADGNLTINTFGSSFDTVLAVYTWPGGLSFAALVPVTCANVPGPSDAVTFPASASTVYYVVVDGVGGAVGDVNLNYSLAVPPSISVQPVSQSVSAGTTVTISVTATGAPPPAYRWQFNQANIPGATLTSRAVPNFQAANEGPYNVIVSNAVGSVTSATAYLYLALPLRVINPVLPTTTNFNALCFGPANSNLIVLTSTNLTDWTPYLTNKLTNGIFNFTTSNNAPQRFFRTEVIYP